jgi:glycosyltransferase involved in cell wall biosynthesis
MISATRLNHCKGIVFCLEAMAALRRSGIEVRYTLVGDGPDAEEIRDRTAALGIADLIEFLPGAPEAEIIRLYHRHDIAVLTSHGIGEITATSIREAMSTGMPVIMSDIGAARTMVDPGVTGVIVPQRDVAAIANAIRWFATNLDRIPQMGAAARDKAEHDFCDAVPVRVLVGELRRRTQAATGAGVPARPGAAVSAS